MKEKIIRLLDRLTETELRMVYALVRGMAKEDIQ